MKVWLYTGGYLKPNNEQALPTESPSIIDKLEFTPERELYLFSLYRILTAALLVALIVSPLATLIEAPHFPKLAYYVSLSYLVVAVLILLWRRKSKHLMHIVFVSVGVDVVAAILLIHAMPAVASGIAIMLLFDVAATATLLPLRYGIGVALTISMALIAEYFWAIVNNREMAVDRPIAELFMFITSYLALAYICYQIAQRARHNQTLARLREAEVASLAEINELIIRRMHMGVLVVDSNNQVTVANEWALIMLNTQVDISHLNLRNIWPGLAERLQRWRENNRQEDAPIQLSPHLPEIQPRFANLLADGRLTLIFLGDTTVVSRRAESLTLSAMGRFSASLAHEIRNPLAAINYACQLLEESRQIIEEDRQLLRIIHQQCQRTNSIVESVLALARREQAAPQLIELNAFISDFVVMYAQGMISEADLLEVMPAAQDVPALVDPGHLQQVLTSLVHNALKYGRHAGQAAKICLQVSTMPQHGVIEVFDYGPGISKNVQERLFAPFFTTSELGTGLGLYIANELCRVNQARLEYYSPASGGAGFKITLLGPHNMLKD